MRVLVDTSVWSLALRRDNPGNIPAVTVLGRLLAQNDLVVITGVILQELLQGFSGPRDRRLIIEKLSSLPLLVPDLDDHIHAAELRNRCRRKGIQVGTIDALIARLAMAHDCSLLTTDKDFQAIAVITELRLIN